MWRLGNEGEGKREKEREKRKKEGIGKEKKRKRKEKGKEKKRKTCQMIDFKEFCRFFFCFVWIFLNIFQSVFLVEAKRKRRKNETKRNGTKEKRR